MFRRAEIDKNTNSGEPSCLMLFHYSYIYSRTKVIHLLCNEILAKEKEI